MEKFLPSFIIKKLNFKTTKYHYIAIRKYNEQPTITNVKKGTKQQK